MKKCFVFIMHAVLHGVVHSGLPFVINTWAYLPAAEEAWSILEASGNALEALVEGVSRCEREKCAYTIGGNGKPDESGETTLDSMVSILHYQYV